MASLSDYAAKTLKPATAAPVTPSLSDYATGAITPGKDASVNYQNDFATFDAKDAVQSFIQKVPIENGAPVTPEAQTLTISQKYNNLSSRLAQLSSEFDIGIMKGVGGVVGGAAQIGNWILAPLGKAIDAATGVHDKAPNPNAGDIINAFADSLEKDTGVTDRKYLDDVAEGLGTALPYIAGGVTAGALKVPALISSLGIGGLQALSTARDDYNELIKSGDKNAGVKAAGVFGIDLALNTVAHFLGPLAQGGGPGLMSSLGRVLKSTLLETGNFGIGQTIVNNVVTGRAPLEGVLDSALVMLPISAAFGAAGEVTNSTHIRAQEKQVTDIVHTIADNGLTTGHAADVISQLTGVPRSQVEAKVGEIVEADPTLQKKFADNVTTDLPDVKTFADTLAGKVDETAPKPVVETETLPAPAENNGEVKLDQESADTITKLESDLKDAYQKAGNGPLEGEKLPEAPTNPGADDGFGGKEQTLEDFQRQLDEIKNQPKAQKALESVFNELDISEAGKRIIGDATHGGTETIGVNSTFPDWIPEELRSKDLFQKLFSRLSVDTIAYPEGNRPRQRELYHLLLDEVDARTGVDTSKIRNGILEAYESGQKKETANGGSGGSKGGKSREAASSKEKVTPKKQYQEVVESAPHEDAFISTLKKNDAFNEENKDKIAAGEVEAKPGLKEFAQLSREQSARGASLRLSRGRKDLGEWAKALDKELTPDELAAQATAQAELAGGREVDAKTQKLLESGFAKYKKFLEGATRLSLRMEKEAARDGEPFNIKEGDAKAILGKLFKPGEIDFIFHTDGYIKDDATAGREALGMYTPGYALENPLIKMVMSDGKVQSKTLYEESFHAYLDNFLTTSEKADLFARTKKHILTLPGRAALKLDGYRSDELAEEWLAHDFADYASEKGGFDGNKGFYASVVSKVRDWVRKLVGAQRVYDNFLEGKRPAPRKLTVTRRMDDMLSVRKASEPEPFKNFDDLSTKLLGKLEGRDTVSKQFISDLTNSADLKQPEKDLIREVLKTEGGQVKVADFADRVKAQLLPLERTGGDGTQFGSETKFENTTLPRELRGDVQNYAEKIYQSPIKTTQGNGHFKVPNYFAHSRIEDLPRGPFESADSVGGTGKTRRVIEIQSDLFQKGRLENESLDTATVEIGGKKIQVFRNKGDSSKFGENDNGEKGTYFNDVETDNKAKLTPEEKTEAIKKANEQLAVREAEVARLEPYRNTWQDRIIREEVRAAAKDGKTKLQFPTGDTAMKVEGLVNRHDKWVTLDNELVTGSNIKEGSLITYQTHEGTPHEDRRFLVTKNNGDGTFQAVDSMTAENDHDFYNLLEKKGLLDDGRVPTLEELEPHLDKDIMGALSKMAEQLSAQDVVDKNNPIYKFYEKEVGRYLKNNYDAKLVTDAQGVTWNEVEIKPEHATKPVSAFRLRKGSGEDMSDEEAALEYYRRQKALAKPTESTPVSRETAKNSPVGEGETRQSAAFERIKDRLGVEEGPTYNQLNLAKDTSDAIDFVENNLNAARRISEGLDLPPAGMTETAISIAYAEKMANEGNFQAAAHAERARSLRQTRRGQEIVAEKGRFNDNSAPTFMRRVMQARLEAIGKAKLRYIDNLRGKTPRQAATKVIEDQAVELKKRIVSRQLRIADAQKLLDQLTCV